MNTRILTPVDASEYWDLRLLALKESPEAFGSTYEEAIQLENPIAQMAERFEEREHGFTLGAWDDEGVLYGVVSCQRERSRKMQHIAHITGMYVHQSYRGQGEGRKLLMDALAWIRRMDGVEQVKLSVVTTNKSARSLYLSLGFHTYGLEVGALKLGAQSWDEEHMVLRMG